ncbi:antizyme inhibitor 2-like isoform X2 [Halichondria panicea]|uniref:antizyme inhibitor 2-like isoform X2 n=1 Tax=Halichondria panicea TaxID=6063 RepID=UPI00312B343A
MCTMPNYYGKSHMRNPYLHVISLSKVIIHWKPLLLFSVKSTVSAVSMEVHISETTTVELGIVPDGEAALREYISNKTSAGSGRKDYDDPFHVVDLGRVLELHRDWVTALPTITPFYAIKCNNDPALLKTLAALGTGFDCASKPEIKAVLDMGVSPDRIIYAHPSKQVSHIKYAVTEYVDKIVFDGEEEMYKIQKHFPSAKLVLRIRADDPDAKFPHGMKFGCTVPEGRDLLSTAKSLGLDVIGVCFHVGTGSQSSRAYELALKMSVELFEYGYEIGYQFSLLDIGGGFYGDRGSKDVFQRVASAINSSLDSLFSSFPGLTVIAEPGAFFACSTHSIAVNIVNKKSRDKEGHREFVYYVNDVPNGSLDCFRYTTPDPFLFKDYSGPLYSTCLWGPTLSPLDKLGDVQLPELSIGDWICFHDVGAYSLAVTTNFNGFPKTKSYYYTLPWRTRISYESCYFQISSLPPPNQLLTDYNLCCIDGF